MFTSGMYERKFIYPSLLLLFLLFLFARYALGGEVGGEGERPVRGPSNIFGVGEHSERDFIDSADSFNRREGISSDPLQDRLAAQENRLRRMQDGWRHSQYNRPQDEDYFRSSIDSRYLQDRRLLDEKRISDTNRYRADRGILENRMGEYNRTSTEYERLNRELENLDRTHAQREREYESQYRNMDADYSISRW